MATLSTILAWSIPWAEAQHSIGLQDGGMGGWEREGLWGNRE